MLNAHSCLELNDAAFSDMSIDCAAFAQQASVHGHFLIFSFPLLFKCCRFFKEFDWMTYLARFDFHHSGSILAYTSAFGSLSLPCAKVIADSWQMSEQ
jgi:hypothetical protein